MAQPLPPTPFITDLPPAVAQGYPTPFFAYNAATIRRQSAALQNAFVGQRVSLYYAIKANDHPAIVGLAAGFGIGACLVSQGEMQRATLAGIASGQMLMNGVGKSPDEIRYALLNGIGQLNIESLPEIDTIGAIAAELGIKATVCLRLNPEIVANTHSHTVTARRTDKFGLLPEELPAARTLIANQPALDWRGFSCHIGSQIHGMDELADSYRVMVELFEQERRDQPQFDRLDLGGGFGVSYHSHPENYARPDDFAATIATITGALQASGVTIQLEPGRFIAAAAGTLVTSVLYVKDSGGQRFVVVDAAMNNLIRPALYSAYHPIGMAILQSGDTEPAAVVGPVCESADLFGRDYLLPTNLSGGERLAIGFAGAYGATMSSMYNARPRLAEVLYDGDDHRLIRRALTTEELDRLTLV